MKNKLLKRSMWIIVLLTVWELVASSGFVSHLIFPSVVDIAKSMYQSFANGEIVRETAYSLVLIARGLFIGIAGAVLLAALSITSKTFGEFMETLTAIAHPLPGIALLPIIIIWVGTGTEAITFIIVHSVIWPMMLNIMTGFKSIPPIYREVGQNLGFSHFQVIANILVPASLPYLISGLKIGWARAWRALISAEMIFGAVGGKGGLGWFVFKKRVFMDTPGIFAGLIIIVIIGIIVDDFVFNKIENATVKKWGSRDKR